MIDRSDCQRDDCKYSIWFLFYRETSARKPPTNQLNQVIIYLKKKFHNKILHCHVIKCFVENLW